MHFKRDLSWSFTFKKMLLHFRRESKIYIINSSELSLDLSEISLYKKFKDYYVRTLFKIGCRNEEI